MKNTVAAANMMNSFVDEATNGMIKEAMSPEGLSGVSYIWLEVSLLIHSLAISHDETMCKMKGVYSSYAFSIFLHFYF